MPTVGVVELKEGKIASEHIYWDQASVLVLLDAETLPVAGAEGVRKLMDPASVPSEPLIRRAKGG